MDPAARLACEAIDLAEPQSRALADGLGREEGFEDAVDDLGRHAGSVVRHRHADIVARRQFGDLTGFDRTGHRLDGDPRSLADLRGRGRAHWGAVAHRAAGDVAQGVAGVDDQIQQGGLELGRVHVRADAPALQLDLEVDCLADGATQQGLALADQAVQVDGFGAQGLAAREGQQLVGQALAAPSGGQGGLAQLLLLGRVVRAQDDVQGPDDDRQQIVEVVGHASGQPAHGLHPLGMHQVGLGGGLFRQGLGHPVLEQLIDAFQVVLGPFGVGDVQAGADIALEDARGVEARHALGADPSQAQGGMIDPAERLEPVPGLEGAGEGGVEHRFVVRMDQAPPGVGQLPIGADAAEDAIALVAEDDRRRGVRHPDQGRGAVGDGAEADFRFSQPRLGRAHVGDVEGDADETDHRLSRQAGTRKGLEPAPFAVMATIAGLHGKGLAGRLAVGRFLDDAGDVVGMEGRTPVCGPRRFIVGAEEVDIGLVDEGALAILIRDPDQHRRRIGDGPEPFLALAGLGLGAGALDLGPGAGGDFLQKARLGLGPSTGNRGVGEQEGAQTACPDQGRADQGASPDGVEGARDVGGARILVHVVDPDGAALGQVGDQALAKGVKADPVPNGPVVGGPLAGH
ncbi:hypothetical protein BREV_BREV_03230 [Brevundimonas mediterranea]|uniref:Uncharacterized protein n=1 Tax=Brevundimonas mediterranea TaxID=74329 RepID=A0A7Z9C3S9_9CAUL|nr:hypothetical protein BREV_BREV_03230 [Brevundimonas mediterranea]